MLVVKGGRIVEQGTYEELDRPGSALSELTKQEERVSSLEKELANLTARADSTDQPQQLTTDISTSLAREYLSKAV